MQPSPLLTLNDGRRIPQLGLGVYKVPDEETAALVAGALRLGYRHVDTATLYRNEAGVGRGVRESGVPREDVFVTTKVWNDDHGYDATLRAFDVSLDRLGLDHVDLYLIHWPSPSRDRYVDTWRALVRLREEGRARSIGVSNFEPHHIERLLAETGETPAVDQVELHPLLQQAEVRRYDGEHGILTESWSPLARGRVLDRPEVARVAARHGVTPAQAVIAWHLALGLVVIPKSSSLARVEENAGALGIALDEEDLAAFAALDEGFRTGAHPDRDS